MPPQVQWKLLQFMFLDLNFKWTWSDSSPRADLFISIWLETLMHLLAVELCLCFLFSLLLVRKHCPVSDLLGLLLFVAQMCNAPNLLLQYLHIWGSDHHSFFFSFLFFFFFFESTQRKHKLKHTKLCQRKYYRLNHHHAASFTERYKFSVQDIYFKYIPAHIYLVLHRAPIIYLTFTLHLDMPDFVLQGWVMKYCR